LRRQIQHSLAPGCHPTYTRRQPLKLNPQQASSPMVWPRQSPPPPSSPPEVGTPPALGPRLKQLPAKCRQESKTVLAALPHQFASPLLLLGSLLGEPRAAYLTALLHSRRSYLFGLLAKSPSPEIWVALCFYMV